MFTSETNEAVAIAGALKPTVQKWTDDGSRSCVRAKKMTVAVPYSQGTIGVREAFSDTVQTIPAMGSLGGLNEGDPVWVMWLYGDKSTMVAMWPGAVNEAGGHLSFRNVSATFTADTSQSGNPTYADFPYRASVSLAGVSSDMIPVVAYSCADVLSGEYAPVAECYNGGVYLYASSAITTTVESIVCLS